jgi:hypothetical protein
MFRKIQFPKRHASYESCTVNSSDVAMESDVGQVIATGECTLAHGNHPVAFSFMAYAAGNRIAALFVGISQVTVSQLHGSVG